jgi:hypothetical protein
MRVLAAAAFAIVIALPAVAAAQRDPWTPGTPAASFARPDGRTRVHYVTTTADAVAPLDADGSGTPDFVEEVARRGDESLAAYAALGFRAPRSDGTLGGDDRVDVYLLDLSGADGHFEADAGCETAPRRCAGAVTMENDFAGYAYPSASIGIRVVVSHELFHAVQNAYDADEPAVWMEGSAVWAEEHVYPEQDDFERFVAGFVARFFRPFERPGAGFGDPYPYGAGLWPYFLAERHGPEVVRAIWERCEGASFLDAAAAELAARGDSLEEAWVALAREIVETRRFGEPRIEPEIVLGAVTLVGVEGMSARFVPLPAGTGEVDIEVAAVTPIVVERTGDMLVVAGVTRGAPVQEAMITVTVRVPDSGGCNATRAPGLFVILLVIPFSPLTRRRGTARAA